MKEGKKKVAFYTLGCKLNFSETSTLAREFTDLGFERVSPDSVADVYVVNTCSVTEHADKKCRQAIRKFIAKSPEALVAVVGCYAQLKPEEIAAIEGVDLVLGTSVKSQLPELVSKMNKSNVQVYSCDIDSVNSFFPAYSSGDRTRSFLKVQDGCDYHCSYCTIPLARGKSRNIPISEIVDQANIIAGKGIKEIILTGVNIGDFGRTTGETFFDLVRALDAVEGIERYRISSIEPNLITNEIAEFVSKSSKFLPHFHIPLQSGSNRILGLMRRRYKREVFAQKISMLRNLMPKAFFGVDVIVGFPGETDEDFQDAYDFLNQVNPTFLHIFPYSERPNTPAAVMPNKVDPKIAHQRVKRLEELSDRFTREFYSKAIGEEHRVLFEATKRNGLMFGFTDNYIKVGIPYNKDFIGKILNVRLTDLGNGYMNAQLL